LAEFLSHDLEIGTVCPFQRVNRQSHTGLIYFLVGVIALSVLQWFDAVCWATRSKKMLSVVRSSLATCSTWGDGAG